MPSTATDPIVTQTIVCDCSVREGRGADVPAPFAARSSKSRVLRHNLVCMAWSPLASVGATALVPVPAP